MLTSGQCKIEAYMGDGGIVCTDCFEHDNPDCDFAHVYAVLEEQWHGEHEEEMTWHDERELERQAERLVRYALDEAASTPLSNYELYSDEGFAETGLSCDDCGKTLVMPSCRECGGEEELEDGLCADCREPEDEDAEAV